MPAMHLEPPPVQARESARDLTPAHRHLLQALEGYVNETRAGAGDGLRSFLRTLQESLWADVVFWAANARQEVTDIVANQEVAPEWCHRLFRELLKRSPAEHGEALWQTSDKKLSGVRPTPVSVAMIRIGRTHPTWAVAVSFNEDRRFGKDDLRVMQLTKSLFLKHRQELQLLGRLKDTLLGFVQAFAIALEVRDPYTRGHSERVARMAARLGQGLGLSTKACRDLYLAGLLHDLGKVGVDPAILQKPGALTSEEYAAVQQHPVIGERLLMGIPLFAPLLPAARNHHERWDGDGYPDGLAGEDIPLAARIIAVADSFDAMMSPRPYRDRLPLPRIIEILQQGELSQWDPKVIAAFMACKEELTTICERGIGASAVSAVDSMVESMTGNTSLHQTPVMS